jgi:hypothetical protein
MMNPWEGPPQEIDMNNLPLLLQALLERLRNLKDGPVELDPSWGQPDAHGGRMMPPVHRPGSPDDMGTLMDLLNRGNTGWGK